MTEIATIIPASADEADAAAFRSLEAALRFAFGNRYRGAPDSLAQHQKRIAGRGGAPRFESDEERSAMAGVIRRRISTMHPSRYALLVVRFAPRAFPCACRRACCSGWAKNEEWAEALSTLVADSIVAVSGHVSNRQLRAGIVQRWAGASRVNIGILAEKCGVHRDTAGKQAKLIRRWLDQLERSALDEADLCLSVQPVDNSQHSVLE